MSQELDSEVEHPQIETSSNGELPSHRRPLTVRSSVSSAIWFHSGMLALSLIVVGLSVTMSVPGEEQVYLPGVTMPVPGMCASRQIFGIDCPGCGLTRSFISIGHGDLERAWHFNPGGALFFLFVAAQIPWRATQLVLILTGFGERWVGKFDWVLWIIASILVLQWAIRFFQ